MKECERGRGRENEKREIERERGRERSWSLARGTIIDRPREGWRKAVQKKRKKKICDKYIHIIAFLRIRIFTYRWILMRMWQSYFWF